jgi:drug/metabolite transporter (DMT)-like permease
MMRGQDGQAPGGLGTTLGLTAAALFSFALNSLLCRAALGTRQIDAATFTLVRIVSGAAILGLLVRPGSPAVPGSATRSRTHIAMSALALFVYALPFSLAYLKIHAGTGAFLLFGCVQLTMIGSDVLRGRRLTGREAAGLAVAISGLGWLTRPGTGSPDLAGAALMVVSGLAWGVYSIRGRGASNSLLVTAQNFAGAAPMAAAAFAVAWMLDAVSVSGRGVLLALASGAVTSGLGYVAWYAALPRLAATHASIAQLAVPPLAAMLGVLLLGEPASPRLLIAAPLILGGIALALIRPARA